MDNKNLIVQFNSPEEAYLYGLGQSIANISKAYQQSMATSGYVRCDVMPEINAIGVAKISGQGVATTSTDTTRVMS